MQVIRIKVRKQLLDAMPETERTFFVLNGHLLNELAILNKLLIFTHPFANPNSVIRAARVAQALTIVRIFVGKLFEGWRMLKTSFFANRLSQEYEARLGSDGLNALNNLKRYFGKKNTLENVRNAFSFHYDPGEVQRYLNLLDHSFESYLYLGNEYANSVNWICEEIVSRAMLSTVNANDPQQALDTIMADTTRVSGWFFDFCGSAMVVTAERHFGPLAQLSTDQIDIGDTPQLDQVDIPFFVLR